jgi:hypothetical protein
MNKDIIATGRTGKMENIIAPANAILKADTIIFFSLYFSMKRPEGIENIPYAIKKENGRDAAIALLTLKSLIISGIKGPIILVRKEIIKNINTIITTMKKLLFISSDIF